MNADTTELLTRCREHVVRGALRARDIGRPVLVSVCRPIPAPEDVSVFLEHARAEGADTVLWEGGTERLAIAGIGTAWAASSQGTSRFRELAAACNALLCDALIADGAEPPAGPLFIGSFAFAPEVREEGPWRGFDAGRLVLPCMLVVRRDNAATLTLSVLVDRHGDADAITDRLGNDFARLQGATGKVGAAEAGAGRCAAALTPTEESWKVAVAAAIADITGGRFEKLVLARSCSITSDRDFDCARVVRRLRQVYPSCATFWIGTAQGSFLGATPETLVCLRDREVKTAAIAGSIARGTSAASDRVLAQVLMESAKDRREHALVVQAMIAALEPLCDEFAVAASPQVLALANVQHLSTAITGRLAERRHLLDLVDRLHPTPAVAGCPRETALVEVQAREPLDRGWYAGPIGWMDARGDGEFAVAIRSALVKGCQASVYAAAGIVAGSDPEAELAETRLKLQPLLSALM